MKKKTFGRIAAVGLAGISVIPAAAIVASADIRYDSRDKSITGEAYRVWWTTEKTTINYYANVTTDASGYKSVSISDTKTTGPVTGKLTIQPTEIKGLADMDATGDSYVAHNQAVTNIKTNLNNLVSEQKKYADNVIANFKASWENYVKDYNAYLRLQYSYQNTKDDEKAEFKGSVTNSTTGVVVEFNSATIIADYPSGKLSTTPSSQEMDQTYTYSCSINVDKKNMEQLATERGKTVSIDANGNINYAGAGGTGATTWTVNTQGGSSSGGSGSGSGTGTSGNYWGTYYIPYATTSTPSTSYYCPSLGYHFPSLESLRAAAGVNATYVANAIPSGYTYSASLRPYFNPADGHYYSYTDYLYGNADLVFVTAVNASVTKEDAIYKVNGLYYYTYTSAKEAAGSTYGIDYVRDYDSRNYYFSRTTGYFYSTYQEAFNASNGVASRVISVGGSYYDYLDPYYYYLMMSGYGNKTSSSSSNSLGGASVTIGNRSGWSAVRSQIRNAKSGASLNVSLNGETSIPQEILTALDGKNVTVNFTLSNGAVVTFNGADISAPKDINVNVNYGTKNISSSLISKAKKVNNGVATSQLSISSNTFGGEAGVSVKFSSTRAGCEAKLYRYNASKNSLVLVDKSSVGSNGRVSFDGVTQGGDYVIILI